MTGNVREWCSDWYAPFNELYTVGKYKDRKGPVSGQWKVLKGGSAFDLPNFNIVTQSLWPGSGMGQNSWKDTGFRVVKDQAGNRLALFHGNQFDKTGHT